MPNIKNISSLRQYTAVLDEVDEGKPVFLTRDGKGKYAIIDMAEYDSMRNALWNRMFEELDDAHRVGDEEGWVSFSSAKELLNRHG